MHSFRFMPDTTVYMYNVGQMSFVWAGRGVHAEEVVASVGIIQAQRYKCQAVTA